MQVTLMEALSAVYNFELKHVLHGML